MKIGLNLLHALPEIGGGWNYIARLVAALAEFDHNNTYIAFVNNFSASLVPPKTKFRVENVKISSVLRPLRIFYENTMLLFYAQKHQIELLHWFANTIALSHVVPSAVTIYDLLAFEKSSGIPPIQKLYLRTMIPYAAKKANILLPMSKTTAQKLNKILNVSDSRMAVIPPIVPDSFHPISNEKLNSFRNKYRLPDRFWLYVAHFYPHKNHIQLLRAFHQLKLKGKIPWPIVLRGDDHGVGAKIKREIYKLNLDRNVILLPRINEIELSFLYSAATALVFPSLYEGGGMPILEALACGCPVISSDTQSSHEFGGSCVSFFDPSKLESIAEAIEQFQKNEKRRLELRLNGLKRVENYRPETVVRRLVNAYKDSLKR